MKELSQQEFSEVLLDVRKAYRLLYLFQSRVLDTVKYIGDQFSFRYSGGWSWFTNSSPKDGKGSLNNWAWDWLNMYQYEFFFGLHQINGHTIQFSLVLVSDTGFFDADGNDERNLRGFNPVELSDTKLLFMVGKNLWHPGVNDISNVYKNGAPDFIEKTEKGVFIVKPFPLMRMLNSDTILGCVAEFSAVCQENGIIELSTMAI